MNGLDVELLAEVLGRECGREGLPDWGKLAFVAHEKELAGGVVGKQVVQHATRAEERLRGVAVLFV